MNIKVTDIDKLSFAERAYQAMTCTDLMIVNVKRDGEFKYLCLCALQSTVSIKEPMLIMVRANNLEDCYDQIESFQHAEMDDKAEQEKMFGKEIVGFAEQIITNSKAVILKRFDMPKNTSLNKEAKMFKDWVLSERKKRGLK